MVNGWLARGQVTQDVTEVSASVDHPTLVARLPLCRRRRHQLQLQLLLRISCVLCQLGNDVSAREGCDLNIVAFLKSLYRNLM